MNSIDASEHFELGTSSTSLSAPSLLTIVLDTNPYAWAQLHDDLPLSAAVADLLVFINAHLACHYANRVAVVASHCRHATWLYPTPAEVTTVGEQQEEGEEGDDGDDTTPHADQPAARYKYPPFAQVEKQLTRNLKRLLAQTPTSDVRPGAPTKIAGALTLALSHINRETIAYAEANGTASTAPPAGAATSSIAPQPDDTTPPTPTTAPSTSLQSRILILSASPPTDAAHHYIPLMNAIFACQRLHIPIDVAALAPAPDVFLQQAADATRGTYAPVRPRPALLQFLLLVFLPPPALRLAALRAPAPAAVDFRAACFCHRAVVDVAYVCSVCLSIFCRPPGVEGEEAGGRTPRKRGREGGREAMATCLTCGTELTVPAEHGVRPAVLPRKKKKKRVTAAGASVTSTPKKER